jgi:hypothetical protein
MRKKICFAISGSLTVILITFLLSGCLKDHITKTYTISRPIYTSVDAVLAGINGNPSQPIASTGKIYVKGSLIFLNDVDKGIHIIDNSDPAHPVQTAFLNIPGNEDIAVKGNTLYADMYGDLLAVDISDLHHVSVTSRIHDVFHSGVVLNGTYVDLGGSVLDNGQVITGWIVKDTTMATADPGKPNPFVYNGAPGGIFFSAATPSASGSNSGATGVAGSMAKMVVINNYMYAITESHSLGIIDVTNSTIPTVIVATQYAGLDLETIYPFGNELFLGSAEGVYMYNISTPTSPEKTGIFAHGRACDPVISDGNFAYITLHAGTSCGGASNELDVVTLDNMQVSGPATVYQMTSPKGLSKDGNLLFVCDGSAGVKVYDATAAPSLKLVSTIARPDGYDVIAGDHRLLLVATQGLYQYTYSDGGQASLLSFFPVK